MATTRRQTASDAVKTKSNPLPMMELPIPIRADMETLQHRYRQVADIYPLSNLQSCLVADPIFKEQQSLCISQFRMNLRGELSSARFRQAWETVSARNPVLRTVFPDDIEGSWQVVLQKPSQDWLDLDWSGHSESEQARLLTAFMKENAEREFEPSQKPPLRFALIRLAEQNHCFVWTYHHLILDDRSVPNVLREVAAVYRCLLLGLAPKLSPVVPYRTFISWLYPQDKNEAKTYWNKVLSGFNKPNRLATKTARSDEADGYGIRGLELKPATGEALKSFANNYDLNLDTLLRGTWAVLVSRYTRDEDVVFGTVDSGRPRSLSGADHMVGLFSNTLPLRVNTSPRQPVVVWLHALKQQLEEASRYAYLSPREISDQGDVPKEAILYESVVELTPTYERFIKDLSGLGMERPRLLRQNGPDPLYLRAYWDGPFTLTISYDRQFFRDDFAARMLEHFSILLQHLPTNERISDLPMLTEEERRCMLESWNNTGKSSMPEETLHRLTMEAVEREPDRVVLEGDDTTLTYRMLGDLTAQLVNHLCAQRLEPEDRVAILTHRLDYLVPALLAVLRVGGAFVLIDSRDPIVRQVHILEDAEPVLLFTERALLAGLEVPDKIKISYFSEVLSENQAPAPSAMKYRVHPEASACLAYVPDDNGKLTAATITHGSIINLQASLNDAFGDLPSGAGILFANAADQARNMLFYALFSGFRVQMKSAVSADDPESLLKYLQEQKIEIIDTTVSLFESIMDAAQNTPTDGMPHYYKLNGDLLTTRVIKTFFDAGLDQKSRLIATYGFPECTGGSCFYTIDYASGYIPTAKHGIRVGKPLLNTQIYVLDPHLCPLPAGVAGEIYVAGLGLARGFINEPKLTALRFVPNPFGKGSRMFQTGDLGFWSARGNLIRSGRTNDQFIVDGHRVDPSEIEKALRQHPHVEAAAVLPKVHEPDSFADQGAEPVAYIVAPQAAHDTNWRGFLSKYLPMYMIPRLYVKLERLPLKENGTLDRAALPPPRVGQAGAAYHPPRSKSESRVHAAWQEVLGRSDFGIHDNFFELGGDSLKALRLLASIHISHEAPMAPRAFFKTPTVAELTRFLERNKTRIPDAPPIRVNLPIQSLSEPQQQIWGGAVNGDRPIDATLFTCLEIRGLVDITALSHVVQDLPSLHSSLNTAYRMEEGRPTRRLDGKPPLPNLAVVDVRNLEDSRALTESIADHEFQRRFHWLEGDLFHAVLVIRDVDHFQLLLHLHLLAGGGRSLSLLIVDMAALYAYYVFDEKSPVEPEPFSYTDYVAWQQSLPRAPLPKNRQLRPDRTQISRLPGVYREQDAYVPKRMCFDLPHDLASSLNGYAYHKNATLFMVLTSAVHALLYRYSGQELVVTGSPIARFRHPTLFRQVGLHTDFPPLYSRVAEAAGFGSLLEQIKEEVVANWDMPSFFAVKQDVHADLGSDFDVMINLNHQDRTRISLGSVEIQRDTTIFKDPRRQLMFDFTRSGSGLRLSLIFNGARFQYDRIYNLFGHFRQLLRTVLKNDTVSLGKLEILTTQERKTLLNSWGNASGKTRIDTDVVWLFESASRSNWDTAALVAGDLIVTHGAFRTRLDAMAAWLETRTMLQTEDVVGVCLRHSPHMAVCLLSILKAGGVFLFINPDLPANAVKNIIQEARLKLIITSEDAKAHLPTPGETPIFMIDDVINESKRLASHLDMAARHARVAGPRQTAYLLFLPNAAGRLQAVIGTHGNLVNLVLWQQNQINGKQSVLQFAHHASPAALQETLCTLCFGGTLHMLPASLRNDLHGLAAFIEARRIRVLSLPHVILNRFLLQVERLPEHLREIVVSGAPLELDTIVKQRLRMRPNLFLHHQCGFAETHVAINRSFQAKHDQLDDEALIGKPITNVTAYILDAHLQLAPAGVPGELFLGGECVAAGYLNQPGLTRERFIKSPFRPSERLFKTGKTCEWTLDGKLRYYGSKKPSAK